MWIHDLSFVATNGVRLQFSYDRDDQVEAVQLGCNFPLVVHGDVLETSPMFNFVRVPYSKASGSLQTFSNGLEKKS